MKIKHSEVLWAIVGIAAVVGYFTFLTMNQSPGEPVCRRSTDPAGNLWQSPSCLKP